MGWKEWPYWLKGGIIFARIFVIIFLLQGILPFCAPTGFLVISRWFFPFAGWLGNISSCVAYGDVPGFILRWIVIGLVFGSLVGWIYGKIKSKK
jgi:hypothetical protein